MYKINYLLNFSDDERAVMLQALRVTFSDYAKHGKGDKILDLRRRMRGTEGLTDLEHPLIDEVLFAAAWLIHKSDFELARKMAALRNRLWAG